MALIELLDFQQAAANKLIENALEYFAAPDVIGGRPVPYVGQLKAVTGAGKTPILANVISKFKAAIVLWTTKFGSVVDQTTHNLSIGGKYNHLLGHNVAVVKFRDIKSAAEWNHILEQRTGVTILVSTVAAWNSSEKDPRLNVHRSDNRDWGTKSRWDQLKSDRQRPLWVVYDEAHNTTSEQIELLDDLEPAGFFVASASLLGGKLQMYLTNLPESVRKNRFASVKTRDVVDAQLLKSTISLADYQSGTEETLGEVVQRREALAKRLAASRLSVVPKAIYVVEKSNTVKGAEARPITIWRTLVKCGVDPASIAVCTDTKELPKDAVKVSTIDELSDEFTHIIFNKKLQEGWDDPTVYCCYFDGRTDSATRIQQVIGRALRQPNAKHFGSEDLNTAYFFINCPNEALEKITDELKEELRIYQGDDEPDDFEPFKIKEERRSLGPIDLKSQFVDSLKVPQLQPELPDDDPLRRLVERETFTFDEEERAAPGKAMVHMVAVRTGDVTQNSRNLLEDMRVRCGTYLQEQIRAQSKNCANAMPVNVFTTPKLNKTACFKSKALEHYKNVARKVVQEYETRVRLEQLVDPDDDKYVIGPFYPTGTVQKRVQRAAHPYYDNKAFSNDDEWAFAKALDKFDHVWVRNKDRVGYGIPLPMKCGSSSTFYPDFLWWVKSTVWALDPTGKFILEEKIRTKLLMVPAPLKIALITKTKLNSQYQKIEDGGWTLVRFRTGNASPEPFDTIEELLRQLITESGQTSHQASRVKSGDARWPVSSTKPTSIRRGPKARHGRHGSRG